MNKILYYLKFLTLCATSLATIGLFSSLIYILVDFKMNNELNLFLDDTSILFISIMILLFSGFSLMLLFDFIKNTKKLKEIENK